MTTPPPPSTHPHSNTHSDELQYILNLLQFLWNGDSQAELTVPGTYKRKMCGLCGNFNGYPQDDLRMKSGQITNSAAIFGNTWKVIDMYGLLLKVIVPFFFIETHGYQQIVFLNFKTDSLKQML